MNEQEIKRLNEQLESLGKSIDAKLEDYSKKAREVPAEEFKKMKGELVQAAKEALEPELKKYNDLQNQVDALETKLKRADVVIDPKNMTFSDAVKNAIIEVKQKSKNGDIKDYIRKNKSLNIDIKADDMTQSNTLTGAVIAPDHKTEIVFDPDTTFRVRDLISAGTTSSSSVTYVYESALSDGSLLVAEAQEYGQSDFDLAVGTATVRKITAYVLLSEELLEDVEGLTSYINSRLPSKLKLKENYQLLYGPGTGINLSGLTTSATAYVDNLADSDISRIDILVDAMRQARDDEYEPTFALIHPTDATLIKLTKDDNGNYIHPWIFMPNGQITLDGVPVIVTTAITAGQFLVGDGKRGAQVFDRRQMSLELSYENEDNFIKGMVTVRISERITIAVYRAKAFIYGSFTSALAQGSA